MNDLDTALNNLCEAVSELDYVLHSLYRKKRRQLFRDKDKSPSTAAQLYLHEKVRETLANHIYSAAQQRAIMGALSAWKPITITPKPVRSLPLTGRGGKRG